MDVNIGDIIEWGSFPQSAQGQVVPLCWRVLGRAPQSLLVLAVDAVELRPYHSKEEDITWEKCSLRHWLNGEFLQTAFTETERAALVPTLCYNDDNEDYDTPGGNDTEDRVFLLSCEEFAEFCQEQYGVCHLTAYAFERDTARVAENEADASSDAEVRGCWWWLRSPGSEACFALEVGEYGECGAEGSPVQWRGGVRPALNISIDSLADKK